MVKKENFLNQEEESRLIAAIQKAEDHTSGEIRVHMESNCDDDALERAYEVFHHLKMDTTELHNGVLFYLALESHKFAIYGDKGINEKVGHDFWEDEVKLVIDHFKKGDYITGMELAIHEVGQKLKVFFPYDEDDENELTNEISIG